MKMNDKFALSKSQLHTLLKKAISTGFFGGIIWPVIWLMAYGLNMIKVNPVSFWDHFFWENLPFNRWYMYIVAILLYCVLSIVFAVIYYALFKKFYHWGVGFTYGMFIWAIFLIAIPFLFYQHPFVLNYTNETLIGLACISIMYGLFIGYSISFDYHMLKIQNKNDSLNN